MTRIRARSADPAEPIFRLQGGPGITNMAFPAASRFADKHDVVLVGYRGVDGSSTLDCPEVTSAREQARGFLTEKAMRADAAALQGLRGAPPGRRRRPRRVHASRSASTTSTPLAQALGYERVDLLSESAGTRTAMIYAWRYPKRIHRSVMIGVNPPGHFLWDAKTTGEQIERYAALCANDASAGAGRRTSPRRSTRRTPTCRTTGGSCRSGRATSGSARSSGSCMRPPTARGRSNGPWTIDTLLAADDGDGSGAWLLSLMAQAIFPRAQVWGDVAAVGRADAAHARALLRVRMPTADR